MVGVDRHWEDARVRRVLLAPQQLQLELYAPRLLLFELLLQIVDAVHDAAGKGDGAGVGHRQLRLGFRARQ